jgi:hypothetical protein
VRSRTVRSILPLRLQAEPTFALSGVAESVDDVSVSRLYWTTSVLVGMQGSNELSEKHKS